MASHFLGTSALVKIYIQEEGSLKMLRLVESQDAAQFIILDVALVEFRSAIRRRERQGDIRAPDADRVLKQIEENASSFYLMQPSNSAVMEEASRLLDSHPLKAYDAIQLAGCLVARTGVVPPLYFVCADDRLCEAAAYEGLNVINPLNPT